jgi:DUF1680 family protein
VASIGDYVYGRSEDAIWINLFVGSNTNFTFDKTNIAVNMQTNYPWEGKVRIVMEPNKRITKDLRIRIPGWSRSEAVPGGLYRFRNVTMPPVITVNGQHYNATVENGYAIVQKTWRKGDVVEITLPMDVWFIKARSEIKQNNNRVAIQRGPLVYCVEGTDNNGQAWNMIVPEETIFTDTSYFILTDPVVALKAEVPVVTVSADGLNLQTEKKKIIAIPYYTWANRGQSQMQVWLPVSIKDVKLNY